MSVSCLQCMSNLQNSSVITVSRGRQDQSRIFALAVIKGEAYLGIYLNLQDEDRVFAIVIMPCWCDRQLAERVL